MCKRSVYLRISFAVCKQREFYWCAFNQDSTLHIEIAWQSEVVRKRTFHSFKSTGATEKSRHFIISSWTSDSVLINRGILISSDRGTLTGLGTVMVLTS